MGKKIMKPSSYVMMVFDLGLKTGSAVGEREWEKKKENSSSHISFVNFWHNFHTNFPPKPEYINVLNEIIPSISILLQEKYITFLKFVIFQFFVDLLLPPVYYVFKIVYGFSH